MVTNGRLRYSSSAMEHLFVDGLPPSVGKGTLLRLLIEDGGLNKHRVGKIVLNGGVATVEVADGWAARLVRVLDGMQVETRRIRVWQQPQTGNNAHFDQLLRWLVLEAEAERQQQAADDDASLTRLVIRGEEMGLGERVLVQLAPRNEQAHLPATRLSVGSPVILREEDGTASWRGVVSRLGRQRLEVALNEPPETAVSTFRLDLAHDEVARQRMQRALARVAAAQGNQTAVLRDVILGLRPAEFLSNRVPAQLHPLTERLNESQKTAVVHALAAEHLAIIHGPPGTGKTTTVAALIATAAQRGDRVLACAPSNLAVDNLAERLAAAGVPLVRLGHPVRVLPELQAYTLDALVEQHDNYRQAKKLRKEAFGLQNQAGKFRRARPERGAKEAMREEARAMLDEARQLEAQAVERVLDGAAVVLSTLTALDSSLLGQRRFDLGVIDEAGQSVEPASWIPLPRVDRLVLAGDHQQGRTGRHRATLPDPRRPLGRSQGSSERPWQPALRRPAAAPDDRQGAVTGTGPADAGRIFDCCRPGHHHAHRGCAQGTAQGSDHHPGHQPGAAGAATRRPYRLLPERRMRRNRDHGGTVHR